MNLLNPLNHPSPTMRRRATLLCIAPAILLGANTAMAQVGPAGSQIVYNYGYDNNSNLTSVTDALGHLTQIHYDALNRRDTLTDPAKNLTQFSYDPLDHVTGITDPRKLLTSYQIDGLDNVYQLQSPDTGATVNTYDPGGNLRTRTDAKQQTTNYSYDALNRLANIRYADGNTVAYTYDDPTVNGIGRLTQISDSSGTFQYAYDTGGRLLTETRTLYGQPIVTRYSYDSVGRLAGMTYPSGRVLSYTRDGLGRINQITSTRYGHTAVLVSQVIYRPFGGLQSYVNSAGKTVSRSFDTAGRITGYTLNGQMRTVNYDGASNIVSYADSSAAANNATYGYDALNRLTQVVAANGNLSYGYDANGNRTSQTTGSASSTYQISPTGNQLTQITGAQAASFVTDPNGSVTSNTKDRFAYDARGRLVGATTPTGPATYLINPLGQRWAKTTSGGTTVYDYDKNGKLISEADNQSARDYVYLDDIPVSVIQF